MAICLRMVNGFTMWKSRPWKVIRICPLFAIRRASFARTATAKAYDVVSKSGAYMSYHWSGENYTLCGWRDPAQYAGAVVIEGTAVKYFPDGSQMPEYTADAEDEITLYEWTWSFEALPATPEKARKRATILPDKKSSAAGCGCGAEGWFIRRFLLWFQDCPQRRLCRPARPRTRRGASWGCPGPRPA